MSLVRLAFYTCLLAGIAIVSFFVILRQYQDTVALPLIIWLSGGVALVCFLASTLVSKCVARDAAKLGRFGRTAFPLAQDLMRVTGGVFFATGVIGVLARSPVEDAFTQHLEHRMWRVFIEHESIADQILTHVVREPFVYRDYSEVTMLSQDSSLLTGETTSEWLVENCTSSRQIFSWKSWYTDVDPMAGKIGDTLVEVFRIMPESLLVRWSPFDHLAKLEETLRIALEPGQVVKMRVHTLLGFYSDNEILTQLQYPCDGYMSMNVTLPESLDVSCAFMHPDRLNKDLCNFMELPAAKGFHQYAATIRAACLQFQGIWIAWQPKNKPAS